MKKLLLYLLVGIVPFVIYSCDDNDPSDQSIFSYTGEDLTEMDIWLDEQFRQVYNISFKYKYEQIETNHNYHVIPADPAKAKTLAKLIKFLWLEPYDELAGNTFTKTYVPRVIYTVGSRAYKSSSSILGTAESGLKVVIYDVNNRNLHDMSDARGNILRTMHHEFAHILHQTEEYPTEFKAITAADYVGSSGWGNRPELDNWKLGFVSQYAGSEPNEDFVETYARYLVLPDEWWDNMIDKAGTAGATKINQKLTIVKNYFINTWGIDLDELREIFRRRVAEVDEIGVDNLYL